MLHSFLAGFGAGTPQQEAVPKGQEWGLRTISWTVTRPSQRGAELGRGAATERIAAPLRIVSADPAPEFLDEAGGGPVRPVPAVPELLLEQAEEALHRRVVRAAALGGLDWLR